MKIRLAQREEREKLKCPECGAIDPIVDFFGYAEDCFENPDYEGRLSDYKTTAAMFRCEHCGYFFEVILTPLETNKIHQPSGAPLLGKRDEAYK